MDIQDVKQLLYNRWIAPTEKQRERYVGVEIELPLVNLNQEAVDFHVVHNLTARFQERFGFVVKSLDNHGNIFALEHAATGDLFTYDCSYNNLEFSFGKALVLSEVDDRLRSYYAFIQDVLAERNHTLTGMGINPHRHLNWNVPVPTGRYRMLHHHLCSARTVKAPMYFHPFYEYGMFASSTQVQLDVGKDDLIPTIKAFNLLEPLKALLFSNSPLSDAGIEYLCIRDLLWESSMQGYNPHNIGVHERFPESIDELVDYLASTSIYCTERNGHYINFLPLPITDYLSATQITGEYFENGGYHPITFTPATSDIAYLRTYKFQDLTFRGTIEFRSVCTQPMRDALAVPAFHLGLIAPDQVAALLRLLKSDTTLYGHGYSAGELRKLLVRRAPLPPFLDAEHLKHLLLAVLTLSRDGLLARGFGEERYLEPLFERAQSLESPATRFLARRDSGEPLESIIKDYAQL
jgi:gamma-glutamylcysteine synthetase